MKIVAYTEETLIASVLSDCFSFAVMGILILLSHHLQAEIWMTTLLIFLGVFVVFVIPPCGVKTYRINSKADAIKWANSLPEVDV